MERINFTWWKMAFDAALVGSAASDVDPASAVRKAALIADMAEAKARKINADSDAAGSAALAAARMAPR